MCTDFVNAKTNKLDHKTSALFYPGGYGSFPGKGWIVGAGADNSELMAYLPSVVRRSTIVGVVTVVLVIRCSPHRCRDDLPADCSSGASHESGR